MFWSFQEVGRAGGSLALVPGPRDDSDLTRVFGAFKDSGRDRQIGDSRNVNNKEARITDGPSHRLPAGSVLTRLTCPRWTYALYGSCVDRKDFYHQAAGSYPRAVSNAIGPVFRPPGFSVVSRPMLSTLPGPTVPMLPPRLATPPSSLQASLPMLVCQCTAPLRVYFRGTT